KLHESEERYRELVQSANSIIMRIDTKSNITFFNEFAQKFFGYREDEIIGKNVVGTIVPKTENTYSDLSIIIQEIENNPESSNTYEYRFFTRTGEKVWITWSNKAIYDEEGNMVEILSVGSDITDRKKAEGEKKKLEDKLQRAQKMEAIGTLAGGVAHDLNNILSGIVSYPDLLLMDLPEDSTLKRPLTTIKRSGEKAAAIVQDLLALARRGVSVSNVVNLNTIVSEYFKSPEHQRLVDYHHEVEFDVRINDNLLNIMGSPVHLSKTIMNLVSNAAEAMPNGGKVMVTTENCYIDRPIKGYEDVLQGEYVKLSVADTGMGISQEDKAKIFEPFYTKKVMGRSGTGLGLAVVWATVKDHNSYLDLSSAEGEGTRFDIYFPATRNEMEKDLREISQQELMGTEKVLVVDDVPEQREIASKFLTKFGYQVETVSSGEEAIEFLKHNTADLVLLDMIMDPGIDGLETYKKILEIKKGQKALIVSGFSETNRVKETLRLGAGAYVRKPYLLTQIGLAVRKELDR
ncbi:MAG: PAS domain S-box protein, partial [Deltaproteobacteria bacterium]|nr:PAS domain S-box protein [Deltaproteobacteria bacterium]